MSKASSVTVPLDPIAALPQGSRETRKCKKIHVYLFPCHTLQARGRWDLSVSILVANCQRNHVRVVCGVGDVHNLLAASWNNNGPPTHLGTRARSVSGCALKASSVLSLVRSFYTTRNVVHAPKTNSFPRPYPKPKSLQAAAAESRCAHADSFLQRITCALDI